MNFHDVVFCRDLRVACAGTGRTGVGDRVQAGDPAGQLDVRSGGLDGNIPIVAGYVPVKLVVIVEEANRIENAIADDYGAGGVIRVRHVDFEFRVTPLAALLVLKGVGIVIGDAERFEKKRVVQALRSGVFDGNGAIESIPGAGEFGVNYFGDFDCAIGVYGDPLVEMLDDEVAGRSGPRSEKRGNEKEKTNGEESAQSAECRHRRRGHKKAR